MPLDPQVEILLSGLKAQGAPPLHRLSVVEARAAAEALTVLAGDPIAVESVRDITIAVDGAEIGARIYSPEGVGPHPVVVFFHGGGWVICSLDTHDNVARAICRDASAVVVSVDYRMAPEFRFPTAVYDCLAATKWVANNAAALGIDAHRLAVCGDSAGGNLAAVVTQMARDMGGPAVTYAALIYPAVDMTAKGGSWDANGTGYFLESAGMEWFMNQYLSVDDRADAMASPLLHTDLSGLPPCFIATCEFDLLRDQGEAYVAALRDSGVHVDAKRYAGLIHGAVTMTGVLDLGHALLADVGTHLRAALHR